MRGLGLGVLEGAAWIDAVGWDVLSLETSGAERDDRWGVELMVDPEKRSFKTVGFVGVLSEDSCDVFRMMRVRDGGGAEVDVEFEAEAREAFVERRLDVEGARDTEVTGETEVDSWLRSDSALIPELEPLLEVEMDPRLEVESVCETDFGTMLSYDGAWG